MEGTGNDGGKRIEVVELEASEDGKVPKELTVEQMLPHIGEFGVFQKLLVLCFCLVLFAGSIQSVLSTFIVLTPSWKCVENNTECIWNGKFPGKNESRCEMNRTSWEYTEDKYFSMVTQFRLDCDRKPLTTLIMSIFFVGWMAGALVCGSVADRFGRKVTYIPCVATILILGFVSPFVNNVVIIVIFRFLIGSAFPGLLIQATVMITEFTGSSVRPIANGLTSLMLNFAWVVLGIKAYYIQNWKYLSIVCTAPYTFLLLFYFFIPESARWLHLHNRNEEAMHVLCNIAKWNKRTLPSDVTLSSNHSTVTVYRAKSNLLHLFKTRKLCIQTCVVMFMWLSCALQAYGLQFAANDLGYTVYVNFILLAAAGLPASLVAAVSLKIIGRKVSTLTLVLLGSITCFVIAPLPNQGMYKIIRLVFGILGKFCGIANFACLYLWTAEIYSTNVRAVAMSVVQLSARVGSGLSPLVVVDLADFGGWIPFVFIGIVSIAAAGVGLVLPETKGVQLKEGTENEQQ